MSSWTRTKQVRQYGSKCEHALAIRMLAFRSVHPHFLRSARPIFRIWTSRSTSRLLPIFGSLLHATAKYLENSNVRIAILKIAVKLYCNTPGNPRAYPRRYLKVPRYGVRVRTLVYVYVHVRTRVRAHVGTKFSTPYGRNKHGNKQQLACSIDIYRY